MSRGEGGASAPLLRWCRCPLARSVAGVSPPLAVDLPLCARCLGPAFCADVAGDGPPRPPLNLSGPVIALSTARKRDKELGEADFPLALLIGPAAALDAALVREGLRMYNGGRSVGALRDLILGVRDFRDGYAEGGVAQDLASCRFKRAWAAVRKWEQTEPGECHVPLPELHWKAMIGACLVVGGDVALQVAEQLVICFAAALRPGEGLALCAQDLVFAVDLGYPKDQIFVRLENHKGAQRGRGRAQHGTIRDPVLTRWLRARMRLRAPAARLWSLPVSSFRRHFDAAVRRCGLEGLGLVPSSLRAGAATALYIAGAPVADVGWALRHRNPDTLRYYVQELGAALARAAVRPEVRSRLEVYARAASALLSA